MKNNMKNKTVKILESLEMAGFIKINRTDCQFVSMITNTPVKLKKACPFKGVHKVSKRNGLINVNYNAAVKRKLAVKLGQEFKDVEYENGDVWYVHDKTEDGKNLPLVRHKTTGKLYFQFFPHKSKTLSYVDEQGNSVTEDQIKPFFYAQSERPDFKPAVISVAMENIMQLKARHITFEKEQVKDFVSV